VEYSLFMAVSMEVMSERFEKRPRATPVAFPPIFARTTSVSVFLRRLLLGTPREVFI
jgi:hypothetical protein